MSTDVAARLGPRTAAAVTVTTLVGIVAFGWPLLASPDSTLVAHASDAPWLFAIVVPLVLVVVLAHVSEGSLGAKDIALLGVLAAVAAALRPFGGGHAGFEPIWIVLVVGGRVFGPGFGFTLGATGMFASALVTGGVGPWLPYQMIAAAWVGLGAGLLPRRPRGRPELAMLCVYGAVAALVYGLLLNLWFWPFVTADTGLPAGISYLPGAELSVNLSHWVLFTLTTSLGFDIPRAIVTVVLLLLAGPAALLALRRAGRRAGFAPPEIAVAAVKVH